jgi:hypothetical protein
MRRMPFMPVARSTKLPIDALEGQNTRIIYD